MNLNKSYKYIIIILGILSLPSFCNNLTLSTKVYLVDQDTINNSTYLKFNLSWDNSWRTSSSPNNYDAVWVFAKYRVKGSLDWNHLTLSSTNSDHFVTNDNSITPEFIVGETNSKGKGVFIQRSSDGTGNIDWDGVKLKWLYGVDLVSDNDSVEVKVFALEMVYIPEGSFYVGDGSQWIGFGQFHEGGDSKKAYQITSESELTLGGTVSANLTSNANRASTPDDFDIATIKTLPANYPKGYSAFYAMKYELTQGQYVDFLNCLTRDQQDARTDSDLSGTSTSSTFVMSNTNTLLHRNSIKIDPTFGASPEVLTFYNDYNDDNIKGDGQYIACNFIHPYDGLAYADWAGLRPLSELEYEKVCRGNQTAVSSEYAWGDSIISYLISYILINAAEYNESITNPSTTEGNSIHINNSTSFNGPIRSGIFASSGTNRIQSGAGYYGAMELTGNLFEQYVDIGNSKGRSFIGSNGDGNITSLGEATNSDWPGYNTTSSNFIRMSFRGGGFGLYQRHEGRVSYRAYANGIAGSWNGSGFDLHRSEVDGFRAGR